MLYLTAITAAVAAGLGAFLVVLAFPVPSRGLRHRLSELGLDGSGEAEERVRRQRRRRRVEGVIQAIGVRLESKMPVDTRDLREKLTHAGYRRPDAVALFLGLRVSLTVGLGVGAFLLGSVAGFDGWAALIVSFWGAVTGWVVPGFLLSGRARKRQKEIQLALPDALDLLVICVEAGLGLNQAMLRVAREIRHVSSLLTEELALTNLQIRAGTARDEALRDLGRRTGVDDVRTLVVALIQTERFGTSIAKSLRVHADTLRLKRKQRAEEAAAKTTIKMIFPLALCVFPALFVVILGPAVIQIFQTLSGL